MDPKDLIKAGKLSEARSLLVNEVKNSPTHAGKRTLLFQVLCFLGEWEKAERHIDLVGTQDVESSVGVQVFKDIISSEKQRLDVFSRKDTPSFLPEAPVYIQDFYAAWDAMESGNDALATELFDKIQDQRPQNPGSIDGKSFSEFINTDSILSFFLEAFIHERYVWIPIDSIREILISEPKTLFDLLWIPAHVTTWGGLGVQCFLPVIYPDSFKHKDEQIKMGRMTDWTSMGESFSRGQGQQVFLVDDDAMALLDMREIVFKAAKSTEQTG